MLNRQIVIVAVVGLFSSAQADIINVGPGDFIQTAIDNAVDGDEIVVAPGTYFETINFLGKAITLRSSNGRDVTIIDAQRAGSVVTCESGEGPDTVLQGFTITGGSAPQGGGMRNINSGPTVVGCVFSNNDVFGGFVAGLGGGMFNSSSNPVVLDCTFIGNFAGGINVGTGGGMYNLNSSPTVIGCTFSENSAPAIFGIGGGMYNENSNPTLSGCTFEGNCSGLDGGGVYSDESSAMMIGCTFSANNADIGGGMIHISGSLMLIDCIFSANSGPGAAGGLGAALCDGATLINCLFDSNATLAGVGGGLALGPVNNALVVNCTLVNNTAAGRGGGLWVSETDATVINSILWGNSPDQIFDMDGSAVVSYSDVQTGWPGTGNIDADPLFVDPDNGDFRLSAGSPCIDAGNNSAVPVGIDTDLDGNPRFLDVPETPDTGNGDPPVVDMGAYESLGGGCLALTSQETVCHPDGTTFTLNFEGVSACTGDTVMTTFTGSGGAVGEDLCFTMMVNGEQGGFCCSTQVCVPVPDCSEALGDLDGDGFVGVLDLIMLLGQLGPCTAECYADLDGDGMVGVTDLLILLGNWD